MAHLNLDLDYFEHPKTKRLVGLLGRGSEVLPIKLWRYCGKYHSEDGRLVDYTSQEIESIVEWWGKRGECVKAMIAVAFLEKEDGAFVVHGWVEMQGHIAALKSRNKKVALNRWAKIRDGYHDGTNGTPRQNPSPSNPSQPSTCSEKTKARLIKERIASHGPDGSN